MADFYQHGPIATLHQLGNRSSAELEAEISQYAEKSPLVLVLPCLYSELEGPAMENIVNEIAKIPYLSEIVIGLDRATEEQFHSAQTFFSRLPQPHKILWNDGPRLRELDHELCDLGLSPKLEGKGRNVWYCLGYVAAKGEAAAVAIHDCDIVTYHRDLLSRLIYPMANPDLPFVFSKGYYARVGSNKLNGRVTRLFYTPLIRALRQVLGPLDYLNYMDAFRYPLSGEMAMSMDVVRNLRIPSDWGLEVGVLSEMYRHYAPTQICQVDIAETYDHKHQPLSEEDPETGLARMSTDIAKSLYRKLATNGVVLSQEIFRSVKATYLHIALEAVDRAYYEASINGLDYDRHAEEQSIEVFLQSIIRAGDTFLSDFTGMPFIPAWSRVSSAVPELGTRLLAAVESDLTN